MPGAVEMVLDNNAVYFLQDTPADTLQVVVESIPVGIPAGTVPRPVGISAGILPDKQAEMVVHRNKVRLDLLRSDIPKNHQVYIHQPAQQVKLLCLLTY
jgi:hypothetical protein